MFAPILLCSFALCYIFTCFFHNGPFFWTMMMMMKAGSVTVQVSEPGAVSCVFNAIFRLIKAQVLSLSFWCFTAWSDTQEEERGSHITGAMRGWQQGELAIKPIIDFQLKPIKVFCLIVNILHAKPCPSAWTPLTPDAPRWNHVGALRLGGQKRWGGAAADQLSRLWSTACSQLQPGHQLLKPFGTGARIQHPLKEELHGWKQSIFQNGDHLEALKQLRRIPLKFNAAPCIVYGKRVGVAAVKSEKVGAVWTPYSGIFECTIAFGETEKDGILLRISNKTQVDITPCWRQMI